MSKLLKKHNFTDEEVQNLSNLLLNEELTNIQVGLQIVAEELGVLEDVSREVLLMVELNPNESIQQTAAGLLNSYFGEEIVTKKRECLELFKNSWWQMGWNYRKVTLANYAANHGDYEPYLLPNKLYVDKLERLLHQIIDNYIWDANDLIKNFSLPEMVLTSLMDVVLAIAQTLLKIDKKHALALESLMFLNALPTHRSEKALEYYDQHQDLQNWPEWLHKRLGEVALYRLRDSQKAIFFFEKAYKGKSFEDIDLFVVKIANEIYLKQDNEEEKVLADAVLKAFLQKNKESVHAQLLWANCLHQRKNEETTVLHEYYKVLDRLPKGLMLTGSIGWVGLMHIDKRFKNEFDVEVFLEHVELLIEQLPHPKQLEQAYLTIIELLEWGTHPSFQDELLLMLAKLDELQS
ncbi:MAG: hypothetical protein GY810_24815 [Aureispira sp.]|nr:hypothetical protein [Aureispira sp.]